MPAHSVPSLPPGLEPPAYFDVPSTVHAPHKPRLPMDIWPDIVLQMSFEALESVTLACRYFRQIAQPLLFRTLVVRPYAYNPKTRKVSPQSNDYQKWIYSKLAFYSAPRIAASVRACEVKPQNTYTDRSNRDERFDDPGRAIIDDVFGLLSQFEKLIDLSITKVVLTGNNLKQLSRLLICPSLTLLHCRSTAVGLSPLIVKNFVLGNLNAKLPDAEGIHSLLLSMVNPNKIESFSLVGSAVLTIFPHLGHFSSAVFSKLHTLCLDYRITASLSLQPLLSKCPVLEEIHFTMPDHMGQTFAMQGLDPSDLPSLKVYHGPFFNAGEFIMGRPVRHLRLWGYVPWDEAHSSHGTIPLLEVFRSSSELESLEFPVRRITRDLLREIFYVFPYLKALSIVVDSCEHQNYGIYTREVLMATLGSLCLPLGIEYLSISKFFPWEHEDTPIFDFVRMKTYLAVYPALRYVSFSGEDFSWRFDAATGIPVRTSRTIDDWRGAKLTRGMITRACSSY